MLQIKKPLPVWAIQLIYFVYSACFTVSGIVFSQLQDGVITSVILSVAPTVHGLLVIFVGKDPNTDSPEN